VLLLVGSLCASPGFNPNPPTSPVKLIFIHHSCGENWLADDNGGLGIALRDNNYFVSDTNYGWGPDSIGDNTDIGHWWAWFCGPNSTTYLSALYSESNQYSSYSRLSTDPGGENQIVMFKSCYPNSHLGGNPGDPPTTGQNLLRGQDCWSEHHTVANAKAIYNDLLAYFATRQDKLFVVITAPPEAGNNTDATHAANARAFNNWLVNDWLDSYTYNNVSVFDFYNILTSNGGDANTNDAGQETGNHHRWWNGTVQHIQTVNNDMAAYPTDEWDSHPTPAGNKKATEEFFHLLNIYYHHWKGTGTFPCEVSVDIKANTSDGPITISTTDMLSINVSLDAGSCLGENADWWVVVYAPFPPPNDWYHYNLSPGWMPGLNVTYQGPLFNLSPPFEVLNISGLPAGTYTFYFGVDMIMNGALNMDQIYYDNVEVTIE